MTEGGGNGPSAGQFGGETVTAADGARRALVIRPGTYENWPLT